MGTEGHPYINWIMWNENKSIRNSEHSLIINALDAAQKKIW